MHKNESQKNKQVIENLQHYIDDSLENQQKQVFNKNANGGGEIQAELKRMQTQLGE